MPRFFVPTPNFSEDTVSILGDDAFHIARALRMAEGDEITVCDMQGNEHTCILTRIRDEECLCKITETKKGRTEPPVKISLYMAYPKGDKLETVIQKAVELGAYEITPFESSRCIKRPKADKAEKQLQRLNRIAEEAAKQCGRGILPTVNPSISYNSVLFEAKAFDLVLFCYEGDGTESLKSILNRMDKVASICVIVGCEGGFSQSEADAAKDAGFALCNLGPRILRCETAPTYVLASLSYHFEL